MLAATFITQLMLGVLWLVERRVRPGRSRLGLFYLIGTTAVFLASYALSLPLGVRWLEDSGVFQGDDLPDSAFDVALDLLVLGPLVWLLARGPILKRQDDPWAARYALAYFGTALLLGVSLFVQVHGLYFLAYLLAAWRVRRARVREEQPGHAGGLA